MIRETKIRKKVTINKNVKKIAISVGLVGILVIAYVIMRNNASVVHLVASPTPEFTSVDGFNPLVAAFSTWQTVEVKDSSDRLVAKIKDPKQKFVDGNTNYPPVNSVVLSLIPITPGKFKNIEEYTANKSNIAIYDSNNSVDFGQVKIGPYAAYAIDDFYDEYYIRRQLLILTKNNVLRITTDNGSTCSDWSSTDDPKEWRLYVPELLRECHDYFSVYTPIAEKVLSTLQVFDYVNNQNRLLINQSL